MEFDFAEEQPKFLMLMYGLIAFVAVVGGLLLFLDVVPAWFARRREAQLIAVEDSGTLRIRGPQQDAAAQYLHHAGEPIRGASLDRAQSCP